MQVITDHLGLGVKTGLPYIWHQRKQPVHQTQEGIQWYLLAGKADPFLPVCSPPVGG